MIPFSHSMLPKKESDGLIATDNLNLQGNSNISTDLQIVGTDAKSYSIWSSLLKSHSHFGHLSIHAAYEDDLAKMNSSIDPEALTIILSHQSITKSLVKEQEHVSCISNTLDIAHHLDIDFDELSILGIQKHLCDHEQYVNYMNSMYNILRLSDIRADTGLSEVVLRGSKRIIFDLNSIRKSDIPVDSSSSFCGLLIEEACQLMKYIGSIDKLNTLEICGINFDHPHDSSYYDLISLLIWYMMEGTNFRNTSKSISHKKQYVIYPDGTDLPLYFYNESISDKWWVNTSDDMSDLIPCSPLDYQNARNGIISERIMKIVETI